jgi:hypothetical protein
MGRHGNLRIFSANDASLLTAIDTSIDRLEQLLQLGLQVRRRRTPRRKPFAKAHPPRRLSEYPAPGTTAPWQAPHRPEACRHLSVIYPSLELAALCCSLAIINHSDACNRTLLENKEGANIA